MHGCLLHGQLQAPRRQVTTCRAPAPAAPADLGEFWACACLPSMAVQLHVLHHLLSCCVGAGPALEASPDDMEISDCDEADSRAAEVSMLLTALTIY